MLLPVLQYYLKCVRLQVVVLKFFVVVCIYYLMLFKPPFEDCLLMGFTMVMSLVCLKNIFTSSFNLHNVFFMLPDIAF